MAKQPAFGKPVREQLQKIGVPRKATTVREHGAAALARLKRFVARA